MIYIDLTGLCDRKWTGVEIYGDILFRMFKKRFGEHTVSALKVGLTEPGPNVINLGKNRGRFFTEYVLLPRFVRCHKNDCIIFPVFPPARICWRLSKNLVPVIHDVVPWKFANTMSRTARFLNVPRMKSALKNAKKIITVSETEKKELQRLNATPEYLVIYNAFENENKTVFDKLKIEQNRYLLSVSTLEPRKNFDYLLQVVDNFFDTNKDFKLVIVGRIGWGEISYKPKHTEQFVFAGYLSDDELKNLYKAAKLFITLPIDEGFGRTPIEAAMQGVPVAVSDIPIFHETLANNCIYLPLNNAEAATSQLALYLQNGMQEPDKEFFNRYAFETVMQNISKDFFTEAMNEKTE
ncbi:MAG: glycosyltransferase family 4 protein [Treponema sp.]|nr:glycosyltransferase family 4 protein [Treponema sp.]